MTAAKAQNGFDSRALAREYIRFGFTIVPIPARSKRPVIEAWQDLRIGEREVAQYFSSDSNIGGLLGIGGLADVDLDAHEAVDIGPIWLPVTPARFGRPSKQLSHYLYLLNENLPTKRFEDPVEKTCILELRCVKREGTVGLQTVLPGSIHPSGEPVTWAAGLQKPAGVDGVSLLRSTHLIAAACLLARHWPERGRHHAMLALIGVLARSGWNEEETGRFCTAVAGNARTGSAERTSQVAANVRDTFRAHRAGHPTTGFTQLRELVPPDVVRKAAEWLGISEARRQVQEWPDPPPLGGALPPVEPFDLDLLPAVFRPLVEDVAERMQVTCDFVAIPLIVAMGAAVGRRAVMQPKAADSTWRVIPNLWGGVVAPPGYMKSAAIEAATEPLRKIERDSAGEYDGDQADYKRRKAEHDIQLNAWKQSATTAAKKKEALPAQPDDEPAEPQPKRYITNDATAEALHEILSVNPAGVLNLRDELSGWLAQLDKPGREADRAFWLEAWNGNGSYTMDRIMRGSIRAEACCVSVLGGIQPGRLRSYLAQALTDGPGNDGLMQRFQLLTWPDLGNGPWRYVDRPPRKDALDAVAKIFARIVQLDPANPRLYRFGPDAQILFIEWLDELEILIRGGSLHPALTSHLAKYRSLMPSLAMLFEIADCEATELVSLQHARQAADWCEYLRKHAERLYSCVTSPEMLLAQDLAAKIKAGKLTDKFHLRDIYTKGWAGLDTPPAARAAVEVLVDAAWVCRKETQAAPRGGRTPELYLVNPKVLHGDK